MKHLKAWFGLQLDEVGFREKALASLGGLVSISLVWIVCNSALGKAGQLVLMPSMGATAVLLFAVPHGPLSQPWPVIGGHVIAAFLGVCCVKIIAITPLAAGLAVGASIAAMHFLKCLHPPGGATALTAVIGGHSVWDLSFSYVWFPVGLNAVLMVLAAIAFGFAIRGRRYPHRPQVPEKPALETTGISHEAVIAAVRSMDTFIDISEEDLITLHQKLAEQQKRRN